MSNENPTYSIIYVILCATEWAEKVIICYDLYGYSHL